MSCIPTSAKCVMWEGLPIDCIDNCRGDSIQDIIYKLSEIVCNLSSEDCDCSDKMTNKNYLCTAPDAGHTVFDWTAEEALDSLVENFLCVGGRELISYESVQDKTIAAYDSITELVPLPECLQYDDKGETVIELPYKDYIILLASTICSILDQFVSVNADISTIETQLGIIEAWIAAYKEPDPIEIVSQCASAPTPGTTVEISTAFEYFESTYCDYVSTLGSTTDWTAALNSTCSGLAGEPQMGDLASEMRAITDWIETPSNVAQNYSNAWLTICDLRLGLQTLLESNAVNPCILAPAENFVIDSYNNISAEISWSKSSLSNIEDPTGFILEVYLWDGVTKGNLVYTTTYTGTTVAATVTDINILAGVTYLLELTPVYACGQANAVTTSGVMKDIVILYRANVSEVADTGVTTDCDEGSGATAYPYVTNTTTVEIVSLSGAPVNVASDTTVILKYTVIHPDYGTFVQYAPIVVVAGTSSTDYDYVALETILADSGLCENVVKTLTCGSTISNTSIEFGTGISNC